jgi:hypothetical protein
MRLGRLLKRAEKSKGTELERDVTHALFEAPGMDNPRDKQDHLDAFRAATGQMTVPPGRTWRDFPPFHKIGLIVRFAQPGVRIRGDVEG